MSSDSLAFAIFSTGQFERFVLKSSHEAVAALADSVKKGRMQ